MTWVGFFTVWDPWFGSMAVDGQVCRQKCFSRLRMLDSQCVKQAQLTCRLTILSFSVPQSGRNAIWNSDPNVAEFVYETGRVTTVHEAALAIHSSEWGFSLRRLCCMNPWKRWSPACLCRSLWLWRRAVAAHRIETIHLAREWILPPLPVRPVA